MSLSRERKILLLSWVTGSMIGIAGVIYCGCVAMHGWGDGKSGALAFLAIFGFPVSLLEMFLEYVALVKTTNTALLFSSICFIVNWSMMGWAVGKLLTRLRIKAMSLYIACGLVIAVVAVVGASYWVMESCPIPRELEDKVTVGMSSQEVETLLGEPTNIHHAAKGGNTWVYGHPWQWRCFCVEFDEQDTVYETNMDD